MSDLNSHKDDLIKYGEENDFWNNIIHDKIKLKDASNRIYEIAESSEQDREFDE
jgi:hypothetical protein